MTRSADRELYLLCFGRVLMQLRGDRRQVAIARSAGFPQGSLSRFEGGASELGVHRLRDLAAALGTPAHAIVELAEQCFARALNIRAKIGHQAPPMGIAMAATSVSVDKGARP